MNVPCPAAIAFGAGVFFLLSVSGVAAEAQTTEPDAETELAIAAQNPISDLMRFTFQDNMNVGIGPNHRTSNELRFQPLIPITLTPNWNLITRTLIPMWKQPTLSTSNENTWGVGPTQFSAFLSPAGHGPVTWGAGPIVQIPTTTDDALGSRTWGAGPTASVFVVQFPWAVGILASQVWSFTGSDTGSGMSQSLVQYFLFYNFNRGWYVVSAPVMTANWKQSAGNEWTVPVGGGVGKVIEIGQLSFNATVQAYANVVRPDPGPDWSLRFQIAFLFPRTSL